MIQVAKSKNKRGCYCGSFDEVYLEEKQIPRGYCGFCSSCGKPGHLRHAPGIAPYTDAWCDSCYKAVWVRNNLQGLSFVAIPFALIFSHWYIAGVSFIIFAAITYAIKKPKNREKTA